MRAQQRSHQQRISRNSGSRGATDIMIMAVAFPVMLGIFSLLYDLTRAPLSDDFMKNVLVSAMRNAGHANTDDAVNLAAGAHILTSPVSTFLTNACQHAREAVTGNKGGNSDPLVQGTGTSQSMSQYAFEFALLKLTPQNGNLEGSLAFAPMKCTGTTALLDSFTNQLDPSVIARSLAQSLASNSIQVPAYWVVGIGSTRVQTSLVKNFLGIGSDKGSEFTTYALEAPSEPGTVEGGPGLLPKSLKVLLGNENPGLTLGKRTSDPFILGEDPANQNRDNSTGRPH